MSYTTGVGGGIFCEENWSFQRDRIKAEMSGDGN